MYEKNKIGMVKSCITREPLDSGESIEEMVRRCTETNEPIEANAPMIYTEESNGVQPEYDIRTDRTDLALDAIDKYEKSVIAKAKETGENKAEADAPKADAKNDGQ